MVSCSVEGCKGNAKTNISETVQFHRFPEDINVNKKWIQACNKKILNTKNSRICSIHFTDESYLLKSRLLNVPDNKRRLKNTAVPTLLLPVQEQISDRTIRAMRKERKELVETALNNVDCSVKELFLYLQKNYDFDFILTNRINQDVIENFFSHISYKGGCNDHPTALEFKYRLRSYLLGKFL